MTTPELSLTAEPGTGRSIWQPSIVKAVVQAMPVAVRSLSRRLAGVGINVDSTVSITSMTSFTG